MADGLDVLEFPQALALRNSRDIPIALACISHCFSAPLRSSGTLAFPPTV